MSILERIIDLCKENNTSVTALETALGFGKSTILGWDKKSPTVAKLSIVADYFNVSLDYLVKGK